MDVIGLHDGRILQVHDEGVCANEPCCIHRPSRHALATAPLYWLASMRIMVRVCAHDRWHPDPDDKLIREHDTFRRLLAVAHECDGCCRGYPPPPRSSSSVAPRRRPPSIPPGWQPDEEL